MLALWVSILIRVDVFYLRIILHYFTDKYKLVSFMQEWILNIFRLYFLCLPPKKKKEEKKQKYLTTEKDSQQSF